MSNQEAETSIHDQAGAGDPEVANRAREVEELRAGVDNIDAAVIHMLTERFRVTRQISHLKAEAGFAPADPGRESEQVERLRSLAQDSGLDPDLAEAYLHLVADAAKRIHSRVAGGEA